MLKRLKKLFKNDVVNNDKGSALSVALIVVTVLTFSLTTVTSLNVNLAGATTVKLGQVNDDSIAKGLIRQAIGEFEEYIEATDSYVDFNNVEIDRIYIDYGVVVADVTGTGDFIDYAGTDSYVYKFSFLMDNGNTLYKYNFSSLYGSSVETFETFDYSLGTDGMLFLNGGYYDDVYLYGEEVFLTSTSPYISDFSGSRLETPSAIADFPILTTSNPSTIFIENGYKYCNASCFNPLTDPFSVDVANYVDVIGSGLVDQGTLDTMYINNFFGDFDYDEYAIEYLTLYAPTESTTFTTSITDINDMAQEIEDNQSDFLIWKNKNSVETYPSTPFVNITGDTNIDFSTSLNFGNMGSQGISPFIVGNVTFNHNVALNTDRDAFFIDGDLTIDNATHNKISIDGSFFITGNLYFTGKDVDIEGSFFVLGETYMNFDLGEGIVTTGNNAGFSIIAKDNIIIEELYETHTTDAMAPEFSAFFYTEESIFVDAVNSRVNIQGSLFARALGAPGSTVLMQDYSSNPLRGIFINSIRGYMDDDVGVESSNDHFNIVLLSGIYSDRFFNIPEFESLVQIPGVYTFYNGEWMVE